MNHGKQLRLFLPDGSASGPRYYELVNWTGQAVLMPVSRIKDLVSGEWPEFERPGVYLVRGESQEGHHCAYIGESENVAKRVQGHPATLGFDVTELLLFSSKDDNLTKSHVLWLESALIELATYAKRIKLTNSTAPITKALSKAELATMLEFLENLKLVAQTAGFHFLERAKVRSTGAVPVAQFYIQKQKQDLKAQAMQSDEGFVILAGSRASGKVTETLGKGYALQREELIEQGVMKLEPDGNYVFTSDALFTSPSAAAAIVSGYPSSGPAMWKDERGVSLGELLERSKGSEV
ncbi:GIY-YIG nuclease family protein [Luteolibacter pohnpeiensis]|uniref:GIY-YIG nuclease family protein n=1 Tax=Luteolibacter pohnpeiensis TaxID=454153 RepID=A0A934S678_9BACT|nr:GIY-YIG nuclease family protein [Luteolibacter pohnpeiensis]MBK1883361.1 GIY-YIG nuclease family protein [Luteolibacter pohnpeiensis]